MTARHRPRPFSLTPINTRLEALAAAACLRRGGMIAHHTATLPGVAVCPEASTLQQLQRFKQRSGPFLLLAADTSTALKLARYISPILRRMARQSWPGPLTLVFPAKPGLPQACYRQGCIAVRVDPSPQCRLLARLCGGLIVSASLNRRRQAPMQLNHARIMRLHRHLSGRILSGQAAGTPSRILRIRRNRMTVLRD